MLARFGLVGLAVALAVAALWFFRDSSERRAGGALAPAAGSVAREGPRNELARAPAPAETTGSRQEIPVEQPATVEPVEETPPSSGELHRLRGLLVHSSDGRPAAGAVLNLHFAGGSTEVVTDADGRFETAAVVPSGAVRAWHRGAASEPVDVRHLEVEPETFLCPETGPAGEPGEVQLALIDPAAWLEIEVVNTNGVPAAAELRWFFRPGERAARRRVQGGRSQTDDRGRARLPFPSLDPGARMVLLARRDARVSDLARVEAPLDGEPVRLVLDLGGNVRVRLLTADGTPVAGEALSLGVDELHLFPFYELATTNASGAATFGPLAPGRYRVPLWDGQVSSWGQSRLEVERGRTVEAELRAPALPLAVSGRVVDQNDLPLQGVRIDAIFDGSSATATTDDQGCYSIRSSEQGFVRVSVERHLMSERFEPAEIVVPCGTRDVLIRQAESRPTITISLEVLDRLTLARIPDAMALGFLDPGRSDWSFHRAREGVAAIELKAYEDVVLAVEAVGYRRQELRAIDLVGQVREGTCRVLLEPGIQRSLQILDAEDERPLLGARVLEGERLVAIADADGRASIDLPSWPAELRIQAEGHRDGRWTCKDWIAELDDGFVWLERAPAAGDGSGVQR